MQADDLSRERLLRATALAAGWDISRVDDGKYGVAVHVNGRGVDFRSRPQPEDVMTADGVEAFLDSL